MKEERETWPEGYKEPDWLWRLEKDWPRPASMWLFSFYGMAAAFLICAFFRIDREALFSVAFACFIAGKMFHPESYSPRSSHEPKMMMRLWLEQKARADAWAGMPWSDERKTELKNLVKWSLNSAENKADEEEVRRAKSLWWFAHRLYKKKLRPEPFESNTRLYEEMLISAISEIEWLQQRKHTEG